MFKSTVTALITFLPLIGAPQNETVPDDSSDLAAIQKLEQTDAAAAKINDVETLSSLWTDDGVLVQPMTAPLLGKSAIHDLLAKQKHMSTSITILAYDEDWKERKFSGSQAFEWGTITVKMRRPDGKEATQMAYLSRLLVKGSDGKWKFARVLVTPAIAPGSAQ